MFAALRVIGGFQARRIFHVVLGQEAQQLANALYAGTLVGSREVRHAAD
jgi:hypothetical protein